MLQPLKDRAERILKDLEERKTTGLAAMDQLAALAAEKEAAMKAARDSGLSARAFAVAWVLREDAAVKAAGIDPMTLAKDAEELLGRFPNASVNADEQRRLHASLYKPLLALAQDLRRRALAWAVKLKVNPRVVRVQEMRRKWGSCSSAGTVTLAADLLDQDEPFQDYVIVHELLHLRYANHGRMFKALMSAHVPGWRTIEQRQTGDADGASVERLSRKPNGHAR